VIDNVNGNNIDVFLLFMEDGLNNPGSLAFYTRHSHSVHCMDRHT
jgi:hypothetical protein